MRKRLPPSINFQPTMISPASPDRATRDFPVREIEAWLLADRNAIAKTFGFKKPLKKISNPESIMRPKEYLRDLITQKSNGRIVYVNTIHNAKIMQNCEVNNLERCASFVPLEDFILRTLR
jgi:hypothetical protein